MRVTHVITRLIVGGAQENTIATVLGLREKPGLEVDLISGPTSGPEGTLEPLVSVIPRLLTTLPALVRPVRPWKDWLALHRLVQIFRAQRPDIVHTHSGKAGILGRLAARRAQVPIIVHSIHGPSFGNFQGRLSNTVYRAAERYAGKFTSHFITVAHAMTRQYLAAGIGQPRNYTRIFSGFRLEPFISATNDPALRARWKIAPGDFVVGKIARLFKLKGHDDLFSAAPAMVRACPGIKFLLVGGGEWQNRFERQARELGLEKHFIFTGLVPPGEVPRLVGIMDILVHLSLREGLPRAVAQACAAARPVVAYNCDGASEVCIEDETGFLLTPGDVRGLTDCIIRLANDPALRARLGRRGQALVQESFPIEKMVNDQYELYLKLMNQ